MAAVTSDDGVIGSESVTLVVHGMGCPLCANNVDKQLLAIDGVRSADVNLGTGEVVVSLDPGTGVTRDRLARAVTDSGYTLREIR